MLNRQLMVHGKPLNYVCQPERRLRLVRPEHPSVVGSCGDQAEGIHDRIEVEGATIRLAGKLMHDAFVDLGDALSRNLGYARIEAHPTTPTAASGDCSSRHWRLFASSLS